MDGQMDYQEYVETLIEALHQGPEGRGLFIRSLRAKILEEIILPSLFRFLMDLIDDELNKLDDDALEKFLRDGAPVRIEGDLKFLIKNQGESKWEKIKNSIGKLRISGKSILTGGISGLAKRLRRRP